MIKIGYASIKIYMNATLKWKVKTVEAFNLQTKLVEIKKTKSAKRIIKRIVRNRNK